MNSATLSLKKTTVDTDKGFGPLNLQQNILLFNNEH